MYLISETELIIRLYIKVKTAAGWWSIHLLIYLHLRPIQICLVQIPYSFSCLEIWWDESRTVAMDTEGWKYL